MKNNFLLITISQWNILRVEGRIRLEKKPSNNKLKLSDILAMIPKDTKIQFWVCPLGCQGIVEWNGDIATCKDCGKQSTARTLQDKREATKDSGKRLKEVEDKLRKEKYDKIS